MASSYPHTYQPITTYYLQHFGRQVIAGILGMPIDQPDLETVYVQVSLYLPCTIDGSDALDSEQHHILRGLRLIT